MLFYIIYRNYIWTFIFLAVAAGIAAYVYYKNRPIIVELEEMKPSRKKDLLIGLRDNAEYFSDLLEPLYFLSKKKSGRKEWVFNAWNEAVNSVEGYEEFKAAFAEEFKEIFDDGSIPPRPIKPKHATKAEKKAYKKKKKEIKKLKKAAKKARKTARKKAKEDRKIAKLQLKLSKTRRAKKQKKLNKKINKLVKKDVRRNKKKANKIKRMYVKNARKLVKRLAKAGIIRNTDTFVTANETTAENYDVIGNGFLYTDNVYDVHLPYWTRVIRKRDGLQDLVARVNATPNSIVCENDLVVLAPEAPQEATDLNATVSLEANAVAPVQPVAPQVPLKRKERRKAKKAAKKLRKKLKKATRKDKKLNKKLARFNKKLAKTKRVKKQRKLTKKLIRCEKKLSRNKFLKKAIKALPISSSSTLLAKGAVK